MHYYTHNIGEFASLTRMMSLDEVGLTMILIDEYVRTEKPIAYETFAMYVESLADGERIATESLTTRYEKRVLRRVFVETADGWICPSFNEQLRKYEVRAEINRANAKRPRKKTDETKQPQGFKECDCSNSDLQANRKPIASESLTTNNHKPITNNQEINKEDRAFQLESQEGDSQEKTPKRETAKSILSKLEKPEDCSDKDWEDWVAFKKKKSKDCTQRMADALVREAHTAGITTGEAICIQLENGWSSFQAEYLHGRNNRSSAPKSSVDIPPIDYHRGINPDGSF